MQNGGCQLGARAAQRVAQRDRATRDVQAFIFRIDTQPLQHRRALGRKGLVQLDQIHLLQLQTGSPEFLAYSRSSGPDPDLAGVRLRDDLPELEEDRRVRAVIEIDRAQDLPVLPLVATTRDGLVNLKMILADAGIDLEVVWGETLQPGELVDDPWPGEEQLRDLMVRYRSVPVDDNRWHFYLLLGKKTQPNRELSLLIDPEARTGAVVFVDPDPDEAGATLHAIGHEIGHLLNLPHPWDVYGNTRSLMSYPWRWADWDWGDPAVFRFDEVGRRFVLRAPEEAVRPGRGRFVSTGLGR